MKGDHGNAPAHSQHAMNEHPTRPDVLRNRSQSAVKRDLWNQTVFHRHVEVDDSFHRVVGLKSHVDHSCDALLIMEVKHPRVLSVPDE
jgi:hypothetical protein